MPKAKSTNGAAKRKSEPERKPAGTRGRVSREASRSDRLAPVIFPCGIDTAPVWAAIEALTGVNPLDAATDARPEVWDAAQAVANAIAVIAAPNEQNRRWLARVPPLIPTGVDPRRAALVRWLEALVRNPAPLLASEIEWLDPAFGKLTESQIAGALRFLRKERNACSVAARLSLACGASSQNTLAPV
jgi:hypothetical protein